MFKQHDSNGMPSNVTLNLAIHNSSDFFIDNMILKLYISYSQSAEIRNS